MDKALGGTKFSRTYKNDCFLDWYKLGKPPASEYWLKMSLDEHGRRPARTMLTKWFTKWKDRAKVLDAEIEMGIVEDTIAEKIEMLNRHADTGREIQTLSLNYLREHANELTPHSAVRLLQVGVEMERDSVGVPKALENMSKLDDESLLKEITAIISSSEVTIEAIEDELQS